MPIYEYRCSACGFDKEYLQKLSDAPITVCERCAQPTMTKLMSAAGFQLKGSGWYATDFKNNGSKPKPKEASAEASSKEGNEKEGSNKAGSKDSTSAEPAAASSESSTAETKSSTESTTPGAPATQPAP
jgi:putative FmdB family regulatory protein